MSGMKRVPVKDISAEELEALNEFATAMRTAQPKISRLGQEAKAIHKATIEAPVWAVAESEAPTPDATLPKDPWSIGAPKVNYVDHIEGDPGESPDRGKESE